MEHLVLQLEKQVMICFEGLPKSNHSCVLLSVYGLSGSSAAALGTPVQWSPGNAGTVLYKAK